MTAAAAAKNQPAPRSMVEVRRVSLTNRSERAREIEITSFVELGLGSIAEDVAIKSPNDGLPPYRLDDLIGQTLRRALREDENLDFADLK